MRIVHVRGIGIFSGLHFAAPDLRSINVSVGRKVAFETMHDA
jgi:hypothetical protein